VTQVRKGFRWHALAVAAVLSAIAFALPGTSRAATSSTHRYVVLMKDGASAGALRVSAARQGTQVIRSMANGRVLVVVATAQGRAALAARSDVAAVGRDGVKRLIPPEQAAKIGERIQSQTLVGGPLASLAPAGFTADPAYRTQGLQWNYNFIHAPSAWAVTRGSSAVTVAVADTGLDYTHKDLASKVDEVVNFTKTERPRICKSEFGVSDHELAQHYGVPDDLDFNGHGSWIGGTIAGALNGKGMNGLAPNVRLVSLKISQWCGSAYDSELLAAFVWAADHHVDVVNISFGGFTDRSDPEQDAVYDAYKQVAEYARAHGTSIVASAGNDHVRVEAGGRVVSHGFLTAPGEPHEDPYGLYTSPGGVPGYINVASTGRVVAAPSTTCPDDPSANQVCKPRSDLHDSFGVGQMNQLAYYSNYGPAITVAAPGGARKFNLPVWDRGGTPGFPYTSADGFNTFEEFSTTSNYAQSVPCFKHIAIPGFPQGQCYSTIQGTSMAAPHAAAALALIKSVHPGWGPLALLAKLRASTMHPHNLTPGLAANDHSKADLSSLYPDSCTSGYCHLGGAAISDAEAYGAGLIDLAQAVR
jgi:subtilisin family serine protease